MKLTFINLCGNQNELVMIPYKALARNPKCNLSRKEKGCLQVLSLEIRKGEIIRTKKSDGQICQTTKITGIENFIGVEFQTENSRHYMNLHNDKKTSINQAVNGNLHVNFKSKVTENTSGGIHESM